jgi:3-oxoadipate enol-lactonase
MAGPSSPLIGWIRLDHFRRARVPTTLDGLTMRARDVSPVVEALTTPSRINVPGAALAYRLLGRHEAPTVMFAHGLAMDMRMWEENVAAFADAYQVLLYDLRGHGLSSNPPAPYTAELLADDAVALLDTLRIDKVHFVGSSLGGIVGQRLARRYPNRLVSLSLCSMASQRSELLDECIAAVRACGMSAVVDETLERWFTSAFIHRSPRTIARVREMVLNTRVNGFIGCASAAREVPQPAMLSQIRVPTLIVAGRQDTAASVEIARAMQMHMPDCELLVVPDAAHLPNVEQPGTFNFAVLRFLAENHQ